jgi:hypothetical protein
VIAAGSLAVVACDHRAAALRRAESIGMAALTKAAESIRVPVQAGEVRHVPHDSWPEVIRTLGPQRVFIAPGGVFLQMASVPASGIFIGFENSEPPTGQREQSFERISDRLYWFEFSE